MIEGITIVTRENLAKQLQQYTLLKPSKIIHRTNIKPILESIKREL